MADYIMTVESDEENQTQKPVRADEVKFDPVFTFDTAGDPYVDVMVQPNVLDGFQGRPSLISVDDIIARRRASIKRNRREDDSNSEDDFDEDTDKNSGELGSEISSEDEVNLESEASQDANIEESIPVGTSDESEHETQADRERKATYFDLEGAPKEVHNSFLTMNLSRPIIKALTSLGFSKPTPIQASAIPVALLGKDIVGNAVTGSGKTAAFLIPMIERLMYREKGKNAAVTRCLILVPTRELGVQCYDVGKKLAIHTDIQVCLAVGGLSVKSQEAALRNRPDIVIATPGRLIDHLRNSPSFTLEALDIIVLDEADRMLSDGFADELAEIIKSCPTSRQTMLFSATMTDSVDELVRMSLNKPVRLFVDPKRSTARSLVQEFVRVRACKETERSALVVALCKQSFKHRVIIFLRSKKLAHQMRIVFGLLGMKCEELHGDLTQEQRLQALKQFRDGSVDFLMATDLASRGLDIKGVETVINYDMPQQLAHYLHRVGRTARAGNKGRSVTLIGEADRRTLKAVIKFANGKDQVRHRVVPPETVQKWADTLAEMKSHTSEILREEKEEKQLRRAEMELKKGQNMMEHEAEIFSRPARTWFQSTKDRKTSKSLSKQQYQSSVIAGTGPEQSQKTDEQNKLRRDRLSGLSRKAKRRKMSTEEEKEGGDKRALDAAIRLAKRSNRPAKIGAMEKNVNNHKIKPSKRRTGSSFDRETSWRKGKSEGGKAKR
ncbi:hypothetical protein APHAL10511_006362 [Amanita phalloides]|nr:hypothetical protein APHAL10511_006362 [Amanita phalloides]